MLKSLHDVAFEIMNPKSCERVKCIAAATSKHSEIKLHEAGIDGKYILQLEKKKLARVSL